jgi:hypothetical protein
MFKQTSLIGLLFALISCGQKGSNTSEVVSIDSSAKPHQAIDAAKEIAPPTIKHTAVY